MLDSLIAGLVSGASYAILAVCVVVLYRLVGVLNFGLAALGALGAYATYALVGAGVALWVAAGVGLTLAAVVSGAVGWVLARWFQNPTATVRSVVTVVLLIVLLSLGYRLFGDAPRAMPSLVPVGSFAIAGVRVSTATIAALAATFLIAGALTLVLRRTQIGLRLQAMSERPIAVQLLGLNTRTLALVVWASTGALATFALLLIAPTRNPTFDSMALLIVPALAAGLLGAFSNVWVAVWGGLAIGALEGASARVEVLADYRGAVPFVIILVSLIWLRRREVWDAAR